MPDFPIDPELHIRASPERVLRSTSEALGFLREMSQCGLSWKDLVQTFEAIQDEWSAMEAVVHLEILLEAEGLLIEEKPSQPPLPLDQTDRMPPGPRFAR